MVQSLLHFYRVEGNYIVPAAAASFESAPEAKEVAAMRL
jgi:hypothetical protein